MEVPACLGPDLRDSALELWRVRGRILNTTDLVAFMGAVAEAEDSHPLCRSMAQNALDYSRNLPPPKL